MLLTVEVEMVNPRSETYPAEMNVITPQSLPGPPGKATLAPEIVQGPDPKVVEHFNTIGAAAVPLWVNCNRPTLFTAPIVVPPFTSTVSPGLNVWVGNATFALTWL